MQVACPSCGHVITVPPEKAALPNLKAKCRCGHLFSLASAAAPAAKAVPAFDPPGPSTGVVRVTAANADRVAEIRAANARAAAAFAASAPAGKTAGEPPPLPARASVPKPAAPRAGNGTPAGATATAAAIAPVVDGKVERPHSLPVPWRRCQNHPQVRSEHVCPKCAKGFCDPCTKKVEDAAICPACEGISIDAASYDEMQERAKQRDRSMMDEIGAIAGYPLRDTRAFVLLSVCAWFFSLFAGFAAVMALLAKIFLTWGSFTAISKVSIGSMRDVMPDFRNPSEIARSMALSLAAVLISAGPFFLCVFLIPGASVLTGSRSFAQGSSLDDAVHAQPSAAPAGGGERSPFEAQREGGSILGPIAMLVIVIAVIWMVAYMPVSLTVAALTRSLPSTLNPVIGVETVKKMGTTYWQGLGIYVAIVIAQTVAGFVLGFIPFAGGLALGFVNAYAALAIGCTLGLAVFKRGAEMGWD
jgi:hypothetical protein